MNANKEKVVTLQLTVESAIGILASINTAELLTHFPQYLKESLRELHARWTQELRKAAPDEVDDFIASTERMKAGASQCDAGSAAAIANLLEFRLRIPRGPALEIGREIMRMVPTWPWEKL